MQHTFLLKLPESQKSPNNIYTRPIISSATERGAALHIQHGHAPLECHDNRSMNHTESYQQPNKAASPSAV